MDRVTDEVILKRIARLQKEGMDLGMDGAYGQFKVTNGEGSKELSPRLPNRQILDWLDAYEKGWGAGKASLMPAINRLATSVDRALEAARGPES